MTDWSRRVKQGDDVIEQKLKEETGERWAQEMGSRQDGDPCVFNQI